MIRHCGVKIFKDANENLPLITVSVVCGCYHGGDGEGEKRKKTRKVMRMVEEEEEMMGKRQERARLHRITITVISKVGEILASFVSKFLE